VRILKKNKVVNQAENWPELFMTVNLGIPDMYSSSGCMVRIVVFETYVRILTYVVLAYVKGTRYKII